MEKIIVLYWHGSKYPEFDYEKNQEFDYTKEKRNEIIDTVIDKGFNVMLRHSLSDLNVKYLQIWIDKKNFRQG